MIVARCIPHIIWHLSTGKSPPAPPPLPRPLAHHPRAAAQLLLGDHHDDFLPNQQQHHQVTTTNSSTKSSSSMNSLLAKKWPRTRLNVQSAWKAPFSSTCTVHGQLQAGKAAPEARTLSAASFLPRSFHTWSTADTITAEVTASPSENWTALHKTFPRSTTQSLMFNTRRKTTEGLPNKNRPSAIISLTYYRTSSQMTLRGSTEHHKLATAACRWCQMPIQEILRRVGKAKWRLFIGHLLPKSHDLSRLATHVRGWSSCDIVATRWQEPGGDEHEELEQSRSGLAMNSSTTISVRPMVQNLLLHLLIWHQNVKSSHMRRSAIDGVTTEADLT